MKQDKDNRLHVFLSNIFRLDGAVANVMDIFSDFVIANLLFVLTSIPIITIGASITALWKCSIQIRKGEGSGVIRCYFSHWRKAFMRTTLVWLFMGVVILLIFMEYPITRMMQAMMGTSFRCVLTILFILWFVEMVYIFPVLNRYDCTRIQGLQRSLALAVLNLPKTLLMMLITLLPTLIVMLIPSGFYVVLLMMFLIGAALISQVNSIIFEKLYFPPNWE